MQAELKGTVLPVLEVMLDPGETIMSEVGEFSWMSESIEMATDTGKGSGGKGVMGALKRVAGGGSFLFNRYTAGASQGIIAFAAKMPGKIIPIDVSPSNEYLCHRRGFLASVPGVEISVGLQQTFRGGIFGGEGFILQKIGGTGQAWVELSGEVITYDLAPGQVIRAHPGHVGLFESSVSFTVQRVPGMANRYLGHDGHHFVVLTGPGKIFLQSMPLPILAGSVQPYLDSATAGASGGIAASALGGLLGK